MHHPACPLIVWLAATLVLQFLGWHGLLAVGAALACTGLPVLKRWGRLVRRARWLLATLWLILAYGTPGEAFFDLSWAPTDAGVAEGGVHVLRLALLLGLLGWLFERLDRPRLVAGLWVAARPLAALGVAADRLVVRLALVFDYLEHVPPRGTWRHLLDEANMPADGPAALQLEIPPWARRDTLLLAGAGMLLVIAAILP